MCVRLCKYVLYIRPTHPYIYICICIPPIRWAKQISIAPSFFLQCLMLRLNLLQLFGAPGFPGPGMSGVFDLLDTSSPYLPPVR